MINNHLTGFTLQGLTGNAQSVIIQAFSYLILRGILTIF